MKVGFIGLGLMGQLMARNVMTKHELLVWNRTKSKANQLVSEGAHWARSPRELVDQVEVLVLMVTNNQACKDVLFGEEGVGHTENKDVIIVNMSTISPDVSSSLGWEVKQQGLRYVEAPVSGTTGPAEQGKLKIIAGGDKKDIDVVVPILETMGDKIFRVGEVGQGAKLKLLVNMNLAVQAVMFGETAILAESLGINPDLLLEVLNNTAVGTIVSKAKGKQMLEGHFPTMFPLQHMLKDLSYGLEMARPSGVDPKLSHLTRELFAKGVEDGLGDFDFSAIISVLRSKEQG